MLRGLWQALSAAISSWYQWKLFIEHSLSISHDSLHVIVGVLLWLALALVLRRPLTSWQPWAWLFAAILWNETVDLWVERWPDPGQQYGEGAKDILLTMLLPTILAWAARSRPDLFRGALRRRKRG
jgi:hypothetical protein